MLARAAVAVAARVQPREERGHGVGVSVVQLDAVEAGLARAPAGLGEEAGQRERQVADLRQLHVHDALAVAEVERLELARRQHRLHEAAIVDQRVEQVRADRVLGRVQPARRRTPRRPSALAGRRRPPGSARSTSRGSGRRRTARKSMVWMKSRVRPPLCSRTVSTRRRRPGRKRSSPMRSSGPLATSRMPVASTTSTPGWPSAKRAYQSSTSGGDHAVLGGAPGHHGRHPGALGDGQRRRCAPARTSARAPPPRPWASAWPAGGAGC